MLLLLAPDAPAVSLGADADGSGAAGEPLGEDEQRKQARLSACRCFLFGLCSRSSQACMPLRMRLCHYVALQMQSFTLGNWECVLLHGQML